MEQLKAEQLFLIDDGGNGSSDFNVITGQLPPAITDIVNIYRFEKTLGRRSDIDFPDGGAAFFSPSKLPAPMDTTKSSI